MGKFKCCPHQQFGLAGVMALFGAIQWFSGDGAEGLYA
jgi:hypothetical protein